MQITAQSPPYKPKQESMASTSTTTRPAPGHVQIGDQRYLTTASLAAMLGVTERTLGRWDAARIGPPKIKVGKLVLYNLEKLPEWLATRETEPLRPAGRRR